MASCVEAGPGSSAQAAFASSNSRAVSQPRRSTTSSRSSATCAGGPPKPTSPIRPHSRTTVARPTVATWILSCMERLFDVPDEQPGPVLDGPLAARMRPRSLDEFAGQRHLLARGSALRTAIESGTPHSMVLYGPPGSGKTTLARLVAQYADAAFEELSAVQVGRAEVREVLARARERRAGGRGTIFFLDEIHRFNKAQQDALLPAVEEGLVVLVGATTETPYFEVNSALLSRTQVYELRQLTAEQVQGLLRRALERGECGEATVGDDVIEFLAARSGGDARTALNALELACATAQRTDGAVSLEDAEDAIQRKAVLYDKG